MSLNISIVGAGIGGLAAAITLRRNGHRVQIFESTEGLQDIGAAITVPLNFQRVMEHFGYSKENLKAVNWDGTISFNAVTGESHCGGWALPVLDVQPNILCHRGDFHSELVRLALGPGDGPLPILHLSSKVVHCDTEEGSLTLSNGQTIASDLVLGADGIASMMRTSILGGEVKSTSCGWSCYRSLIDRSKIEKVPELAWLHDGVSIACSVSCHGTGPFRWIFVYPCRDGTLFNVTAMFEDLHQDDKDWQSHAPREEVHRTFAGFHPQFHALIALMNANVTKWKMRTVPTLPTWVHGRAALLGDAAHATMPTLGQGAAMAVEDAAALGVLLPPSTSRADVPARLIAYEALRKPRGEFVGRESVEQAQIEARFGEYYRSPEMQSFLLEYDAVKAAQDFFNEKFGGNSAKM
ncbi:FAD/NAD(P)-binding domain-containing protein [Mycena venus]|uniref:FAD/NAD(P)-binding domain-containing protein n=1 Tax=Mycena venus TaxID=2733690 RepID=A0A8H6X7D8_9AGAR|nr:FAD/NAD(P)-binding domain-containing protein [Mycena venus]